MVGLDGSELSPFVLDFAARAAAQRGIGLTAVHACCPPGSSERADAGHPALSLEAVATVLRHAGSPVAVVRRWSAAPAHGS